MKVKLFLLFSIILSTSIIAQENIFNKTYKNSSPNIEFGVGYLLNPTDADYGLRYQFISRNILLNKKIGFMYTLEPNTDNNSDVFGVNFRFSNNFSFQAGTGLFYNSFFDSNDGARKKLSLAYHPDFMPLTVTAGYSIDMGPSLGINYRIFFNNKKKKNKSDLTKISNNTSPNILTNKKENIIEKTIDKTKSNITKKEPPTININNSKESTINTKNEQNIISNQTFNEKKITNKVNAVDSVRKPVKEKIVKKEIKKPTVDTEKLSKESKVLFSLNTYKISNLEKNNLKKLSKYLKENPKSRLIIYGSTDKSGSEEYNLSLSEKRANSSKKYLIELGVNSSQLKTIALGESKSQNANSESEKAQARSSMFKIEIEK
ncbi:MAG: OmpA family protein [Flavobacteriales bacterium]|nr:OmpA family protein [Flavobacteriales bacterium]